MAQAYLPTAPRSAKSRIVTEFTSRFANWPSVAYGPSVCHWGEIMAHLGLRTSMLAVGFLALLPALAHADAPKLKEFRAYLIYEDSGDLSKNLAKTEDQIVANDDKGTSVQMVVDIVMTGKANQLYENNPILHVVARSTLDDASAKPLVDTEFPLTFMAKDKLVRTVVVDHACNGFDIDAYMMDGKKKVSEIRKSFSITCGD